MKITFLLPLLPSVFGAGIPTKTAFDFMVCSDPGFMGLCTHYGADVVERECYSIVDDWKDKASISSVQTARGTRCVMYPNDHCDPGTHNDDDELFVSGGYWDLADPEVAWEGRPQSFWCERI